MNRYILDAFYDEVEKIAFKTGGGGVATTPGAKVSGMSFKSTGGLKVSKPNLKAVAVGKRTAGIQQAPAAVAQPTLPKLPKNIPNAG